VNFANPLLKKVESKQKKTTFEKVESNKLEKSKEEKKNSCEKFVNKIVY
jgi:hypothetical protein